MKIKIEPNKFRKLIEAGMVIKGRPLIDPLILRCNKGGVQVLDFFSNILAVNMSFTDGYFSTFESDEEVVNIPFIVLERLSWGFKDEVVDVFTKDDKIFLKGTQDSYDTIMDDLVPKTAPVSFKETEHGLIPEESDKFKGIKSALKIKADNLKLPPGKAYWFEFKNKNLDVRIPDGGNFVRRINGDVIGDKDIRLPVNGDYYNAIVNNLEGEILLVLDEDTIVFAEKGESYMKTYLLSPLQEE